MTLQSEGRFIGGPPIRLKVLTLCALEPVMVLHSRLAEVSFPSAAPPKSSVISVPAAS